MMARIRWGAGEVLQRPVGSILLVAVGVWMDINRLAVVGGCGSRWVGVGI